MTARTSRSAFVASAVTFGAHCLLSRPVMNLISTLAPAPTLMLLLRTFNGIGGIARDIGTASGVKAVLMAAVNMHACRIQTVERVDIAKRPNA